VIEMMKERTCLYSLLKFSS